MENSRQTARHPVFAGVEMGIGTWAWGDQVFLGVRAELQSIGYTDAFFMGP
jgi:hypothetical protein